MLDYTGGPYFSQIFPEGGPVSWNYTDFEAVKVPLVVPKSR